MSSYCAISPTSSAPWLRRRATTSSMLSTANMMRRMPSVFAGALSGSALTAGGGGNFARSEDTTLFRSVAAQAGNDVVDVVDSEHDAAYAQRVRRRAFRLGSDRRRRVELRQLNPAVAVWGPHHGDVGTDVFEPDGAVHPRPLDLRFAFQLHTEFGEERFGSLEVVDNDENVVHPLNRHIVVPTRHPLPALSRGATPRSGR